MPETRSSNHPGGSPLASADYVPDALGVDSGARGESLHRAGEGEDEARNQEERDRIISELLTRHVLEAGGSTYRLTFPFLAKLADSIVSLREWIKEEKTPVLHLAILSTMIEFHEGTHSQQVSDAVALVEEMITQDIEFRILNR